MSTSLSLYRLQQVDNQNDQNHLRLEVIRGTLENNEELQRANEQLSRSEAGKREAERTLHQIEADVEGQQIKIEQAEASLYGGSVHNPKELQDLQNEVAALKRHLSNLEDHQLEAMMACESAEKAHQETLATLNDLQSRLVEMNSSLAYEQATLMRDLERLHAERQAVVSALSAETLAQYEQLRQQRRGVAVATIADNTCSACGTTLTPSQQQNVRSTIQINHCPSCGRILYAG